jgi:uncharacterized protein YecE (DUF72 family)
MGKVRIGPSGWTYADWADAFYPEALPASQRLAFVGQRFDSAEINGTFYSLKSPAVFRRWHDATPDDFVFAVKGSRYITHMLRLRDADTALANFLANGLLALGPKLGPILWQLPPTMGRDLDVLRRFCALLPRDTTAAARLARGHDARVDDRAFFDIDTNRRMRHAFELRDRRAFDAETIGVLHDHGHALVFADTGGRFPYAEDITAGFVYVRLHGPAELYASGYDDDGLRRWARRIRRWYGGGEMKTGPRVGDRRGPPRKQRDVYVYFDNDVKAYAPRDATRLAQILGSTRRSASRDTLHHRRFFDAQSRLERTLRTRRPPLGLRGAR